MPAYKDEKHKTWYAKFNYKDENGQMRFTTKRGFPSKKKAEDYEKEFKRRINEDINMTFRSLVELYRNIYYPRIRISTAAHKDFIIDQKLLPYFGDMKVRDITARDIMKWQSKLLKSCNQFTGKPYSQTYLRTLQNQLTAILNFAVKYYDLPSNPVHKAGSLGKKNPTSEMRIWTLEEYLKFSEVMKAERPFFFYCFEVLYWTGIREGEFLALTYDDFDFTKKTVSITKTYQIIKGEVVIGPPKTARGIRVINMPDRLVDELKEYFESTRNSKIGRAFPTSKPRLTYEIRRGAKRSGNKQIRIHDLRHSHVSLLIQLGFNAVDIAKRVGHESIAITLRYAHMFPNVQNQMMNKLNDIMEEKNE